MMNTPTSKHLEMRWLPVVDGSGRTRMEATWVSVGGAPVAAAPAAAHAA